MTDAALDTPDEIAVVKITEVEDVSAEYTGAV